MPDRPHILIFNPDEWRGDVLGHAGNPAAVTPNLDRLAATDGVSFSRAFCQNPVCTPSRCSFMTGWYPHVHGHRTMYHMLRPHEPMLLRTLRDHGYFVWWGGKNDVVPGQDGFDPFCDVKHKVKRRTGLAGRGHFEAVRGAAEDDTYYSFYVGRLDKGDQPFYHDGDWGHVLGAIEFIERAPADRPLCIYLPLGYPHCPYAVEEPWYSAIDRVKLPPRIPAREACNEPSMLKGIRERQHMQTWTEERWTELRATYYGMCARVDHQFGMVLDALRDAGLYDDTAVFFFSDHGDFAGDYGLVEKNQNTFEDCLTRVPLVVKPPAGVPLRPKCGPAAPGGEKSTAEGGCATSPHARVTDALVELIDLPATVEALTGIAPQHTHFGRSLLPLIAGEAETHRDAVFCEGGRLHGERHCMELESTSSQKPTGFYWPRVNLQSHEGPEHTKAVMCRTPDFKYVRRLYESDELYDLRTDPAERQNRIDDPALAAVLADLKERLLTFFLGTGDVVPFDTDKR